MLHNRAEDWEVKAHQAEGESSSVRLELLSIDTERRHLRERVELLEKEIQEVMCSLCLCRRNVANVQRHCIKWGVNAGEISFNGNLLPFILRVLECGAIAFSNNLLRRAPLLFYCSKIHITSNLPF